MARARASLGVAIGALVLAYAIGLLGPDAIGKAWRVCFRAW